MQENVHKNGGEKSHKCNNCGFSTASKVNLKIHMRRYNSEKLFKCDQCNYEGNHKLICGLNVIVVIIKQVKKFLTPHTTKTRGNDVLQTHM